MISMRPTRTSNGVLMGTVLILLGLVPNLLQDWQTRSLISRAGFLSFRQSTAGSMFKFSSQLVRRGGCGHHRVDPLYA